MFWGLNWRIIELQNFVNEKAEYFINSKKKKTEKELRFAGQYTPVELSSMKEKIYICSIYIYYTVRA